VAPATFDDLVGQQHVTETLKNAIKNDRVAHAYIFFGSAGRGKNHRGEDSRESAELREGAHGASLAGNAIRAKRLRWGLRWT